MTMASGRCRRGGAPTPTRAWGGRAGRGPDNRGRGEAGRPGRGAGTRARASTLEGLAGVAGVRVGPAGLGATNASPMADRGGWIDRASPDRTLDWRE